MSTTNTSTMTDNPTMTINELERNIFLHAAEVLRMHRVECLNETTNDFNIACYANERGKIHKCAEIVYEFIKKNLNYLYILTQDAHIKII